MPAKVMATQCEKTFLEVLSETARSISDTYGPSEAQAADMADTLTHHIQQRFGGERVYVHAKEQQDIKRRIRAEFNGRNARELCAKYGISRAWFYRLVDDR